MYSQHDIEEFAYVLVLCLFNKIYRETEKSHACDLCIPDRVPDNIENNQVILDYGNRNQYHLYTGFLGDKSYLGYMVDSMYSEDQDTFYKSINAIYDINTLFNIGLPMIQVITDDILLPKEVFNKVFSYNTSAAECEAVDTEPTVGLCIASVNEFGYVAELWNGDVWDSLSVICEFDELINTIRCNAHVIAKLDTSRLNDDDAIVLIEHYFDSLPVLIHDVKLDAELSVEPEPVEVVVVPQEVVEEPQEELSLSTTTEDNVMNTSTVWLDWSISTPCLKAWELDFSTAKLIEPELIEPEYVPEVIPDFWEQDVETEVVVNDLVIKPVVQLYLPAGEAVEHPIITQPEPKEEYVNHTNWRKRRSIPQWRPELRPTEEIETSARIEQLVREAEAKKAEATQAVEPEVAPKPVTVSDKEFAELIRLWEKVCPNTYVSIPLVDYWDDKTSLRPIASATGRDHQYSTQVKEFKSTLINLDEYDITRNIQVDVATTTPATPKAPKAIVTPKVSTATFANNFNSLVMAKYRELNNGIIKDSLVLNKLTSALRANNVEAYTNLITTFGNATAVALHRQAYDAVVSAS